MNDCRKDPALRKQAILLSALVLTPDSGLEAFRKHRANDPDVDSELLKKARAILDNVALVLCSPDRANRQRLSEAHRAMAKVRAGAPECGADSAAGPPPASQAPTRRTLPVSKPAASAPALVDLGPERPPSSTPARLPPGATNPPALAMPPPISPWQAPRSAPLMASKRYAAEVVQTPMAEAVAQPLLAGSAGSAGHIGLGPALHASRTIESGVDQTVAILSPLPFACSPLPFHRGAQSPPPPLGTLACAKDDALDSTAVEAVMAVPTRPLPFSREPATPATQALPSFGLVEYAAFCVARQARAEHQAPSALSQTAEEQAIERAFDSTWAQRLRDNADERRHFESLVHACRLRKQRS